MYTGIIQKNPYNTYLNIGIKQFIIMLNSNRYCMLIIINGRNLVIFLKGQVISIYIYEGTANPVFFIKVNIGGTFVSRSLRINNFLCAGLFVHLQIFIEFSLSFQRFHILLSDLDNVCIHMW